ncbi:MAG: hypothetical protein ABI557_21220, partial [Aureliella sp.]
DIDKSETFVGEPLNSTFSHDPSSLKLLMQRLPAQDCPSQLATVAIIPEHFDSTQPVPIS